ncbi:baseplate assembly protein [Morganella morganii]|mgnify:CR=1 FL=1|uniref:baseplate assembly protein n=1 Tax=Morganella morganii TaxID=582 RepID=UPI00259DCD5F|nr:baseplate assembly protein [Morganella morganii]EKU6424863.1 baseplate assembly protein [Morganella morganii]ELA9134108.1 baseplate assembly protein [Morganella morganii]ELB1013847.1 baseplate assembly protein [Morganella morganii]ELB1983283.1 baseplate assembly protein [Morganella morganii]
MPTIDISRLPPPDVIVLPEFEQIFSERKAALLVALPEEQREPVARVLQLESEPLVKLLQESAYRELLLRQYVNESARACMVAFARGGDLDQLGANNNVPRLVIQAADDTAIPPVPAVYESDSDFRMRIPQAFEGMSVAGPVGAYVFHARSASGQVADASAISQEPACVTVSVLSREGDGTAPAELLAVVDKALNDENVRPVADRVTVQSVEIVNYSIDAVLYLFPTPESEPIEAAAREQIARYVKEQHRIGRDIRLSAIYAALHVEGVQRVELNSPAKDIVISNTQASFCTGVTVTVGGSDE